MTLLSSISVMASPEVVFAGWMHAIGVHSVTMNPATFARLHTTGTGLVGVWASARSSKSTAATAERILCVVNARASGFPDTAAASLACSSAAFFRFWLPEMVAGLVACPADNARRRQHS